MGGDNGPSGMVRHNSPLDRLISLTLVVGPTLLFGRHVGLFGAAPVETHPVQATDAQALPPPAHRAGDAERFLSQGRSRPEVVVRDRAEAAHVPAKTPQLPAAGAEPAVKREASVSATLAPTLPRALPAGLKDVWIFCAGQWQECVCAGTVRWGTQTKFQDFPLQSGESIQKLKCSIDKLKDVAPGEDSKHCQCQVSVNDPSFGAVNPALLQDIPGVSMPPLAASCELFEQGAHDGAWGAALWESEEAFCSPGWASQHADAAAGSRALNIDLMRKLQRAWVDRRFVGNYRKLYDASGWVNRAFVNYYAGAPDGKHAKMTEELIVSVHKFSSNPIVVFHFGSFTPESWTSERFPRLVLIHAEPFPASASRSFNFNKMRAMLLARIKTGVQLDSDQFVAPGVDAIFDATEREITSSYPMPILPAHFLDRTPRDTGKYWERYCPGGKCEFQTARWGHAHPTWTYWAAPFIGRWLRRNLRDETLPAKEGGRMVSMAVMRDVPEDEDLLNVATWEEKGTKQWCKLDLPGPEDFEALLRSTPDSDRHGGGDITGDRRFHPHSVAKVYYTAHHAVDPERSAQYIKRLEEYTGGWGGAIGYKGKLYRSGDELRKAHPDLTCLI